MVNLTEDDLSSIISLNESGHNLLDENDSFYKDICVTFTTENGTDMSLNDRKEEIGKSGENLCQTGCKPQNYNYTNKKVKCNCNVNSTKTITNLNDISFNSVFMTKIIGGLKYSNYLVLKCYKLLLNFELIKKNIGFIFMAIIFISLLIIMFIYIIKGRNKIDFYIQVILKNKMVYIKNRKKMKKKEVKIMIII